MSAATTIEVRVADVVFRDLETIGRSYSLRERLNATSVPVGCGQQRRAQATTQEAEELLLLLRSIANESEDQPLKLRLMRAATSIWRKL